MIIRYRTTKALKGLQNTGRGEALVKCGMLDEPRMGDRGSVTPLGFCPRPYLTGASPLPVVSSALRASLVVRLRIIIKFNVYDCSIIELDKHHSERRGNLSVVQNGLTVPFNVKRIYYLYDVPGGESRGAHAHRDLSQLIVAASGSFRVTLDDGNVKRSFVLNRPYQGLYVRPGIWRDLDDFSSGAVSRVLASDVYKVDDYIRDYDEFMAFRHTDNTD